MNRKNTAVKRIHADVKELATHPSPRYHANPLDDDIFEWHFTIRGPVDSDFAGGIYHGRILLSPEYPFKPPHIIFLTKNGRFEVGTKICLSISAYHPEHWQPAWGVRTMLEAIISFFPSEGSGAIGALDWTPEERKKLAVESHSFVCPICGEVEGLIELPEGTEEVADEEVQSQVSQLHMHGIGASPDKKPSGNAAEPASNCSSDEVATKSDDGLGSDDVPAASSDGVGSSGVEEAPDNKKKRSVSTSSNSDSPADSAGTRLSNNESPTAPQQPAPVGAPPAVAAAAPAVTQGPPERDFVDDLLFYALLVIGSAICYLLFKKYNLSQNGYRGHEEEF